MPFDGLGYIAGERREKIDAVIDLMASPDRWCKGALRSVDGRYCLRGAILAENAAALLEAPILQAICEVSGRRYRRIESFNDDPQTDYPMIAAVLLRARSNIIAGNIPAATAASAVASIDNLHTQGVWKLMHLRDAMKGWFNSRSRQQQQPSY
jgi:hypothetical protein